MLNPKTKGDWITFFIALAIVSIVWWVLVAAPRDPRCQYPDIDWDYCVGTEQSPAP